MPESDRPRREGPVPNTEWEAKGDPRLGSEELKLTSDALAYYEKVHDLRREHADEARAEAGEVEFSLGANLRVTWAQAQRADKTLALMFGGKPLAEGYRVAPDGLLERHVKLPPPVSYAWVPIVPDGQATANLSWKRWVFFQCHVGIMGAHRNVEKTVALLSRQVWWQTMRRDVEQWIER